MSVVHPLELSHHPKWNSSTLYQQKSFIIADPPKKFHTKFHITWVHATLHLILIYIAALETHLYDMPRTQQSIWPGPHPVPLTTEGEQKGTNASFLFLSSSSVSRHGALSCCPRRTPSPCHWSSLTDVSNFALLSWIFSQVSLGSFELIHLISHTWPKSCPILSFRAVHWGQSFPPVCIFLSLYCCSTCGLLRRYALALSQYNRFFCTTLVWGVFPWSCLFFHSRVEEGNGSKTRRGTNYISTGTKIVPVRK